MSLEAKEEKQKEQQANTAAAVKAYLHTRICNASHLIPCDGVLRILLNNLALTKMRRLASAARC